MFTNSTYIVTFSPKLSSPKLFLYFWVKSKYFFCSYAFYQLNNFCGTIRWNTLYQKMNMIIICPYLDKINLITLINAKAYFFRTYFYGFRENYPPIFCRTYKMIQQNSNIMTFMYILTHIVKIYLIFEAELRGIRPKEIKTINRLKNKFQIVFCFPSIFSTVMYRSTNDQIMQTTYMY